MKLELFNSARKDTGLSHYYEQNDTANQLFLPASTVERDMATLYTKGDSVGDTNNCGDRLTVKSIFPYGHTAARTLGVLRSARQMMQQQAWCLRRCLNTSMKPLRPI